MSIQIKGLKELQKGFEKAPAEVYKNLKTAIGLSAFKVVEIAKEEAPVGKTQMLKRSIRPRFSELRAIISPNVPYAKWVHDGTRPHEILPVRKKALYWKGALHPVKRVSHPGTKANPFMERTVGRATPEVQEIFRKYVDKSLIAISKTK